MKNRVDAMTKREPFQVFDRAGDIVRSVKDCVYITTKAGDKINTMAIEWGTLGNLRAKPVFTAFVRDSRFTREMLDRNPEFTINIPDGEYDRKIFKICGGKSGRDTDKIEEADLTPVDGISVSVSGILELPVTLECRVICRQPLDVSIAPDDVKRRFYPHNPGRDHDNDEDDHIIYIGEILNSYVLLEE